MSINGTLSNDGDYKVMCGQSVSSTITFLVSLNAGSTLRIVNVTGNSRTISSTASATVAFFNIFKVGPFVA